MSERSLIPVPRIERVILNLRGHNVMLDADLAAMYRVETKDLVRAVEAKFGAISGRLPVSALPKGVRRLEARFWHLKMMGRAEYRPYAFTEQGVAMLSSVLRSPRAVRVNVEIMRAFVKLRRILESHAGLAKKLDELEKRYDAQFRVVFDRDPRPHGAGGVENPPDRIQVGRIVKGHQGPTSGGVTSHRLPLYFRASGLVRRQAASGVLRG